MRFKGAYIPITAKDGDLKKGVFSKLTVLNERKHNNTQPLLRSS